MANIFSGIEQKLKTLEKDRWYSQTFLRKNEIYSESMENNGTSVLTKDSNGEKYFLGVSVINYYRGLFELSLPSQFIPVHSLAFAIGSSAVYGFIEQHPEVGYDGRFTHRERINAGGFVRTECLSMFKDLIPREKEVEDKQKELIKLLPDFELDFKVLTYLSKNKDKSLEELTKAVELSIDLVEGVLYALGYRQTKSRDQIAEIGERMFCALHETRPWTDEERERLNENYHFVSLLELAGTLRRKQEDIEYQAKLLGLEKFFLKEEYTISEVLRLSRISYDELQQALFRGELQTRKNEQSSTDEMARGAILIRGESLVKF